MGYALGVDMGTTRTVAMLMRKGADPRVCALGEGADAVATAIHIGADGAARFGDAAALLAATEARRVVRGFSQRISHEMPILVGEDGERNAYHAHDLAAAMVAWVVARVCEQEGAPPQAVAVTHPATWRPRTVELFRAALAAHHLPGLILVTEAAAAARAYADVANVLAGDTLAVYDLGGGTFDAAVLRAEPGRNFSLLGRPVRRPEIGGTGLDDSLVSHVISGLGAAARARLANEPAAEELRSACAAAKEALSVQAEVSIALPDCLDGEVVTLTRATLETVILGAVASTVRSFNRCLAAAGVAGRDLSAVLLVGGASRIPLVVQLISAHFDPVVDVVLDLDPTTAAAAGAALAAADHVARGEDASVRTAPLRSLRRRANLPSRRAPGTAGIPLGAAADAEKPADGGGLELARHAAQAAAYAEEEAAAREEVAWADRAVLAACARAEAAEAARTEAETAARAETARATDVCAEVRGRASRAEAAHAEADAAARLLAAQAAAARAAAVAAARAAEAARAAAESIGREADERVATALAEVEKLARKAIAARQDAEVAAATRAGAAARAAAAATAHAEARAAACSAFEALAGPSAGWGRGALLPTPAPGAPDAAPAPGPATGRRAAPARPGALVPRRPVAKSSRPVTDGAEDPAPAIHRSGPPPQVPRGRPARAAEEPAGLRVVRPVPEPDAGRPASSRCLPIEGLEDLVARRRGAG